MSTVAHPRRPAMLEQAQAEQIPGAEDTITSSQVAHLVAQALLGWHETDDEQAARLRTLIENGGLETVNELWASSPATTLPGTLWRLYLIHQWYLRDPEVVIDRFTKGIKASALKNPNATEQNTSGTGQKEVNFSQTLDKLMGELASLWQGNLTRPLPKLLEAIADFLLVLTYGVNAQWITDQQDELANPITLRHQALLLTAKEIRSAARKAQSDNLD